MDLEELGQRIRDGRLVAFPTETVYGLGANGLDVKAVLSIYEAKERPLSDPVILHVPDVDAAFALLDLTPKEESVFRTLAAALWPGPLSLVGKAQHFVPMEVSAGTGFVAVRCPDHPVALKFLEACRVPVAGPSANKFGHISPSCPAHVRKNFPTASYDVAVIDGGPCGVGIESSVVEIREEGGVVNVRLLRRGFVTVDILSQTLSRFHDVRVGLSEKQQHLDSQILGADVENVELLQPYEEKRRAAENYDVSVSPGTALTHYSPTLPMFLVSLSNDFIEHPVVSLFGKPLCPHEVVLIDFRSQLSSLSDDVGAYLNLSGDSANDVSSQCFRLLHEAEDLGTSTTGVKCIVAVELTNHFFDKEEILAVSDRIFRAASGKRCHISREGESVEFC